MKFSFKIWILTITLKLLDVDPTDGNVSISIKLSWR